MDDNKNTLVGDINKLFFNGGYDLISGLKKVIKATKTEDYLETYTDAYSEDISEEEVLSFVSADNFPSFIKACIDRCKKQQQDNEARRLKDKQAQEASIINSKKEAQEIVAAGIELHRAKLMKMTHAQLKDLINKKYKRIYSRPVKSDTVNNIIEYITRLAQ